MKTLLTLILTAALVACGGGEDNLIAPNQADGVACGKVDTSNAPAGWCATSSDIVHLGKPNS